MRPLLCASLEAATTAELCASRDCVDPAVDLIELRLDSVKDPNVGQVLEGRKRPVIVTCRPTWEGGRFNGSEEERHRILAEAIEAGADYVDVEWRAGFNDLVKSREGRGIVLSMHDFEGVPSDLESQYRMMRAMEPEVVKVAVHVRKLSDMCSLLQLRRSGSEREQLVLVGMGPVGQISRVLASHFGSRWSYAGENVAPGQLSISRMLEEFRFKSISASSDVYGVVGSPISHSVSPAMHNAAFENAGIDAVYVPIEAVDIEDFIAFTQAIKLRGASVTAPFKRDVIGHLDEIDSLGKFVGAVNTIRMEDDRWIGMNSDVPGFLMPLSGRINLEGLRVSVLGAGGAARAVAVALDSAGARVTICARNIERAESVASLVGGNTAAFPPVKETWDILVNTTPIGTYPLTDLTPLEKDALKGGQVVYDLVYNPPKTRLLAEAERAGCQIVGGLDMLVSQAKLQFEWWTGRSVSYSVLHDAALASLGM